VGKNEGQNKSMIMKQTHELEERNWLRGEKEKGRGEKHTGLTNKRANNTGKVATVFVMCRIAL
jgi:hypothetical protein